MPLDYVIPVDDIDVKGLRVSLEMRRRATVHLFQALMKIRPRKMTFLMETGFFTALSGIIILLTCASTYMLYTPRKGDDE